MHLLDDGHLSCVYLLAIEAAINIHPPVVLFCFVFLRSFLLTVYLGVALLGHIVILTLGLTF